MGAWATLAGTAMAAFVVLLVEAIGYFAGKRTTTTTTQPSQPSASAPTGGDEK
jgi:hypothetical protein